MKRITVRILGKYVRVPDTVVKRGHTRSWIKRQVRKRRKPRPTFGDHIRKQMVPGIKDSAYGPDPPRKRRWNQK